MKSDTTEQTEKDILSDKIKPLADIRTYVENRIELFSLSIAEQTATAISASIQKLVGIFFLSVGAVFLWIALGFYLGELLNSQALGFFLAALPLLLAGALFYNRSSRNLENKIQKDIIKKIAIDFDEKNAADSNSVDGVKKLKRREGVE